LITPAILFGSVLVFLLTLGEVGVPMYLRYPVYPVQTLTQFAAFYDFGAATASAIPMVLITVMILALEYRFLHKQFLALRAATPEASGPRMELGYWRFPLFGIALVWSLITVALPLAMLLVQTSPQAFVEAFAQASDSIMRSPLAVIGATLLTAGVLLRVIHDRTFPVAASTLGLFLYAAGIGHRTGLISLGRPRRSCLCTPVIIILGYLAQYTHRSAHDGCNPRRDPRSSRTTARLAAQPGSWPAICRGTTGDAA
jgi:iron(III) transport system permease protein